jgi:hypothetical protein
MVAVQAGVFKRFEHYVTLDMAFLLPRLNSARPAG